MSDKEGTNPTPPEEDEQLKKLYNQAQQVPVSSSPEMLSTSLENSSSAE